MKKYIKFSALAAAALLTGVACQKEYQPVDKGPQSLAEGGDGNFSVTFGQEPVEQDDNKTFFSEEGGIWWSQGDGVLFAQLATVGGTVNTFKLASKIILPEDLKLLSVTIKSFNTPDPETDAAYFSIHPYSAYANRLPSGGIIYPLITLPDVQTPSAACFDPAADILISEYMVSQAKETSFKLKYKRTGALSKMTVKGLQTSCDIDSIEFSAVKGSKKVLLAGSRLYDLVEGCFSTKTTTSDKKVYRILADCRNLDTSSDFDVFMSFYPFELGEGDSFTVKAYASNGETFTRTVELGAGKDLKFEEGRKTNFTVNMSTAEKKCSWFSLGKSSTANTTDKVNAAIKRVGTVTISSVKRVAVRKATFDTIDDLDAYIEEKGTALPATGTGSVESLNSGKTVGLSSSSCTLDTEYVFIVKVTDSDGRSALLTYNTRTDWCKVELETYSAVNGAVKYTYTVKDVTTKSKAYRIVPTSKLEGVTDLEDYYLNTLKPGTQPQATIDAINAKDGAGYAAYTTKYHTGSGTSTASMVSGTSYTILVKFVNSRGESAFRSAAAVAK